MRPFFKMEDKDNQENINKTPSKIVEKIHDETTSVDDDDNLELVADEINEIVSEVTENVTSRNLNVFKTIQSVVKMASDLSTCREMYLKWRGIH